MPPDTRAELIGGVVYMPSPLSDGHGETSKNLSGWLFHYKRKTPGVRSPDNATVILGPRSEPQPDTQLRIPAELGGQSRVNERGYVTGPPELIVEVGRSSRRFDLGAKKADYERAGVREYLFVGLDPDEVRWSARRGEHFEELRPGPDDRVFRSEVFPGLWLDPDALFAEDLDRLIAVLDLGLATPEHAAFVAALAARRGPQGDG